MKNDDQTHISRSSWKGKGIVFLLGLALGIFISWLVPYLIKNHDTFLTQFCAGQMKQIALALHDYHEVYGSFPPAYTADSEGKRLHSWRTLILPLLNQMELYQSIRLDEPWDSEYNTQFHLKMPTIFCCPADKKKQHLGATSYVGIEGKGFLFDSTNCTEIKHIFDGTSNTLMLVETLDSFCWMAPMDINMNWLYQGNHGGIYSQYLRGDAEDNLPCISAKHSGINICFVEGVVYQMPYSPSLWHIREMATIAGGETFIAQ